MAVAGYNIYVNGVKKNTSLVTNLTYALSGLNPSTSYAVTVSAVDDSGNESAQSAAVNFTTNAGSSTPTTSEYIIYQYLTATQDDGNGTISRVSSPSNTWDARGYATKAINGDNAIICKASAGSRQMIALTNAGQSTYLNVPINIILSGATNEVQVLESGTEVYPKTAIFTDTSVCVIRMTDGVVTVEIDGSVVYTSGLTFTFPLTPVVFLHNTDAAPSIINAGFENSTNLVASPI